MDNSVHICRNCRSLFIMLEKLLLLILKSLEWPIFDYLITRNKQMEIFKFYGIEKLLFSTFP